MSKPEINDELVGLYDNGACNPDVEQGLVDLVPPTPSDNSPNSGVRARYVGESWYASYVLNLSASGAEQFDHQRPLQLRQTAPAQQLNEDETSGGTGASTPHLPPSYLVEQLVEDYFSRFHILCPILDRPAFLQSVQDGSVSPTLLRCVMYVASIHCKMQTLHRLGFSSRVDAGDELFGQACAAFDADRSSDRLTLVQSSYLLHYWFGDPTMYRDARWWLAAAIGLAQRMGLHRRSRTSTHVDAQQGRRVWWCLYVSQYPALSVSLFIYVTGSGPPSRPFDGNSNDHQRSGLRR